MVVETIDCKLCNKSITKSRWSQHVNSKTHCQLAEENEKELEDIDELCQEDGVKDDTDTETDCESDQSY